MISNIGKSLLEGPRPWNEKEFVIYTTVKWTWFLKGNIFTGDDSMLFWFLQSIFAIIICCFCSGKFYLYSILTIFKQINQYSLSEKCDEVVCK